MGGDFAPEATVDGVVLAREELPEDVELVLVGHSDIIKSALQKKGIPADSFAIQHAPDVIGMGEKPTRALTQKPQSSISVGFALQKKKIIDAFASAGNTGAMLVGAIYTFGAIPGVNRPCTMTFLPKESGGVGIMLDVGTNTDCKPETLKQFGIIGAIYAKSVLEIETPKVAILNIGEEEEKGNNQTLATFKLLKDLPSINFVGNIEGRHLFKDNADVVVTDGYTGNIVLKVCEAMYRITVKRGFDDNYLKRFNYENYGGTPILGINNTVIVGHGISNAKAIKNMLLLTYNAYMAKLPEKIERTLNDFIKNS